MLSSKNIPYCFGCLWVFIKNNIEMKSKKKYVSPRVEIFRYQPSALCVVSPPLPTDPEEIDPDHGDSDLAKPHNDWGYDSEWE